MNKKSWTSIPILIKRIDYEFLYFNFFNLALTHRIVRDIDLPKIEGQMLYSGFHDCLKWAEIVYKRHEPLSNSTGYDVHMILFDFMFYLYCILYCYLTLVLNVEHGRCFFRLQVKSSKKSEFDDTKGAIRIRIPKKNRQHNGQKKKYKRTNNNQQNIYMYIKLKIE